MKAHPTLLIYEVVRFPTYARDNNIDIFDIFEIDLTENLASDGANDVMIRTLILSRLRS